MINKQTAVEWLAEKLSITFQTMYAEEIEQAKQMARNIKERHGATPYGFQFITRSRGKNDLDSKVSDTSNMYYLGGKIRHLDFIILENKDDEQILISNMKNNGWDRVIENNNSWKITQPLEKDDVVLDWKP